MTNNVIPTQVGIHSENCANTLVDSDLRRNDGKRIDPNHDQRRASDPHANVWVSASAGTGKTKVLTDRLLRLMLPTEERIGARPETILCLTFTKAVAAEMASRIALKLGQWAVMDDAKLQQELTNLFDAPPPQNQITAARQLFARVIDAPGRLKIMTIHSFCRSILERFPLEAELSPNFEQIDENDAQKILRKARDKMFQAALPPSPPRGEGWGEGAALSEAVSTLGAALSEDDFVSILNALTSERVLLQRIKNHHGSWSNLTKAVYAQLDVTPNDTETSLIQEFCALNQSRERDIRYTCKILSESDGKTDLKNGAALQEFLELPNRAEGFDAYQNIFLTEGKIRKRLATGPAVKAWPEITTFMTAEAERILAVLDQIKSLKTAQNTAHLLAIAQYILDDYAREKLKRGVLDYDDLINRTAALLKRPDIGQWVMFKLDGGLSHILIDEAQDTNPEHWSVVDSLTGDFFSGKGLREEERTLFVVGDEKQSIYSFQRADPALFKEKRSEYRAKITNADYRWDEVPMSVSFRSVHSVLSVVDHVFASPSYRAAITGLDDQSISHTPFRAGQAGHIEVWPLVDTPKKEMTPWALPLPQENAAAGGVDHLCRTIAEKIKHLIESKDILPSAGRPVGAGDVMILLKKRTTLMEPLVKALKKAGVPVSGVDRLRLNKHIAVMDMLAAAEFGLMKRDDLTLAALLKSPFIGMSEEDLFTAAYKRKGTLYHALSDHKDITDWLDQLIVNAPRMAPYQFFSMLLNTPCPAHKTSGLCAIKARLGDDALEPLDELLNAALSFAISDKSGLQGFCPEMRRKDSDLKREIEDGSNAVRIMTVHGAKGLQAPIVFLPDTTASPISGGNTGAGNKLLWPLHPEDVPLWVASSGNAASAYQKRKEAKDFKERAEHFRLLYVALTRAEDRLYICGLNEAKEESWYSVLKHALKNMEGCETKDDGALTLSHAQTKDPDRKPKDIQEAPMDLAIDTAWMFRPAPQETAPPAPLTPSRPDGLENAPTRRPSAKNEAAFRRGNLTHKLLEFLPDLAAEKRAETAKKWLKRHAQDVSADIRSSILNETMRVLTDPEFAPVFGAGSMAEVSVTGKIKDPISDLEKCISGQIDRLIVTDEEILIVDYKTNRPPPTDPKDIPAAYRYQLAAYRQVLESLYPARKISCALLWTETANLMKIK